jgi:hypothetical protein
LNFLAGGFLKPIIKIILYVLAGLIIIGIVLYIFVFRYGSLAVNPTPVTAKTTVNNDSLSGPGKFRLANGTYNVKIESDGYVPYITQVNIKSASTLSINAVLKQTPVPKKLYSQNINFLTKGLEDSLLFLSNGGKTLYRMNNITTDKQDVIPITPDTFSDLTEINWSPDKNLAVMKKNASTFLYDFKRYDLLHQEISSWPDGVGEVAWSPDGAYIAYYFNPSGGEKTIIRADKSNSNQERLYNLKDSEISDPKLVWSADGKYIILVTDNIYLLNVYTKELKKIVDQKKVNDAVFTPDSQSIIYSNSKGLFLTDLTGQIERNLEAITSTAKIVFYSDTKEFLAAIPKTGKSDSLLKINYETGETKEYYYDQSSATNFTNMVISSDKKTLFYQNMSNLYSLDLSASEY